MRMTELNEPSSYRDWLAVFTEHGAELCLHREITRSSDRLRVFLRHDIDLLDAELITRCADLEAEAGVHSTWFFLAAGDKRYKGRGRTAEQLIDRLLQDGHEIGYHVNAWEKPGTFEINEDPIMQLDEDLKWFADVCGQPVATAAAHGIPQHKDHVSNLSLFEPLLQRNVSLVDPFIIKGGTTGRRIPHFHHRSVNPLLADAPLIAYFGDSGGPVRKCWSQLPLMLCDGAIVVFNTHCGNYDIHRRLEYRESAPKAGAIPDDCDRSILV